MVPIQNRGWESHTHTQKKISHGFLSPQMLWELLWIVFALFLWRRLMAKLLRQSCVVPIIHFTNVCGNGDLSCGQLLHRVRRRLPCQRKTQITWWTLKKKQNVLFRFTFHFIYVWPIKRVKLFPVFNWASLLVHPFIALCSQFSAVGFITEVEWSEVKWKRAIGCQRQRWVISHPLQNSPGGPGGPRAPCIPTPWRPLSPFSPGKPE